MASLQELCASEVEKLVSHEVDESEVSTELGNDGTDLQREEEPVEEGARLANLIVFDWDDTLLPTTWLQQQGLLAEDLTITEQQESELLRLAVSAADLLGTALYRGSVAIVTNAERGWVEFSCQKFMPGLATMLPGIHILSARSTYEQHGLYAPTMWKFRAFEDMLADLQANHIGHNLNFVSVGDSLYEQEAVIWATKGLSTCYAKAVKLDERPTIERLVAEHELLGGCLSDLIGHEGDLDLDVGEEQ